MSQIFWKGLTEKRLQDGRLLLSVEFEDKSTDTVHRWSPKWRHMAELTQRAYEVEVANETSSPYEPLLNAARGLRLDEGLATEAVPRPAALRDDQWLYCFECDWHMPGYCCYFCHGNPEVHQ